MKLKTRLAAGAAVSVLMMAGAGAAAEPVKFDIAPQSLTAALNEFGVQSNSPVLFTTDLTGKLVTRGVSKEAEPEVALAEMLTGTGLSYRRSGETFMIVRADTGPQSGSAAGDGAEVEALIVTAQKREEDIQDVPIAISAFTQEDLTRSQIAGGPDLMTQVPNMTFTKTNFTSYSIQLRGIGTQAISATVDPAVAVAFNNTPFLRAHFFEQEFYDLERVEVLRGPQGTLYGRNATAGVVNLISAKPKFDFAAKASGDISNYNSSRIEGMLNLPLVEDKVALRLAGARTRREGYTTNINNGNPIDGRDLWSTRVSLRVDPTDRLSANFIWEHFEEDDDRLRSAKQTCKRAVTPETIGGTSTNVFGNGVISPTRYLNQGCVAASVYSPDAFGVPDGLTLPYYLPMGEIGGPVHGNAQWDVYASATQSPDLRVIESSVDPVYRASSDTVELNVDYDLTDTLTLSSQTGYNRDFLFSTQDYNRFNTKPGAFIYSDPDPSGGTYAAGLGNFNNRLLPSPVGPVFGSDSGDLFGTPCDPTVGFECYTPGIFCDPQIGCSDRLVLMDLATARSRQFSQEFRVASNYDGPFNFSLGANYLRYKTLEDYYVFINSITLTVLGEARRDYNGDVIQYQPGVTDNHYCLPHGFDYVNPQIPSNPQGDTCAYIDPNPVTDLNGQGHNYFRSQNPYKLQSYAVFGEAYYDVTPNLQLTAGLRWTVDQKRFESIPSQLLVAGFGYPSVGTIEQEWSEPTGRLVATWKPELGFTDQTMVYGSYTHGYKAGGANPPGAVLLVNRGGDIPFPTHPATFAAEFIDAYELGTKNTLLDGELTFNLTGFYYDYTDYQISEIVDRSAINLNFDAKIWGVELETDWRPLENLRFGLKVGYEDTQVADGEKAVDLMDRTAGHEGWVVIKPFPTQASNCVLPDYVVAALLISTPLSANTTVSNGCSFAYLGRQGVLLDPVTADPYIANPTQSVYFGHQVPEGYPGFDPLAGTPGHPYTGQNTYNGVDYGPVPNRGAGFDKDLSGNMLPNAPHWTGTLTADYTIPLPADWLMTLHTDLYYQSEAWTRIFNMEGFDKLKAYTNVNLAAIFSNEDAGWTVMAYIKNVFDKDNITGAFLNSDDTGLTNNVFLNEPRLYGLRVTKNWNGSPWWGAAGPAWRSPLRLELEGYHGNAGADHELYVPDYADLYPDDLQFPADAQNDLAAMNGGGLKLTWQPAGSIWSFSGAVRYGRAGGGTQRFKAKNVADDFCIINTKYCRSPSEPPVPGYPGNGAANQKYGWHTYYHTITSTEEAHTFADFAVGRDFGLGQAKSTLSAGLGYGRLRSSGEAVLHGNPDFYFPAQGIKADFSGFSPTHGHVFNENVEFSREFEGWGPEINWDTAMHLVADQDGGGAVGLDLGLGAVVLFGKQENAVTGHVENLYTEGNFISPTYMKTVLADDDLDIAPRSKDVSVPGVRANLGLSYSLGGLKLGAGYRWERYYDAMDGGLDERESYDRTFEGPYMKLSIGFGG